MDAPKPRRFQFGLRALFISFVPVAIVALPLGWYLRRPAPPRPVPVSGTVTLDGQPLDCSVVIFFPVDGVMRAAGGTTNFTGGFRLKTFLGGGTAFPGAFPGPYKVTLLKDPNASTASVIPVRYGNLATSGLTAEVTVDGPNVFGFGLTSE